MESYFRVVFYIDMVSFSCQFSFTFLGKSRTRKRKTHLPTIMLYPWSILSSTLALDQWVESLSYCQKGHLLNGTKKKLNKMN